MEKYKVCPNCKTLNEPDSIECTNCEEDLSNILIIEIGKSDIQMKQKINYTNNTQMVKICECGEVNPPNARKCSKCNNDLSFVFPTEMNAVKTKYFLESLDHMCILEINEGLNIIGRENLLNEYLNDKKYVSRKHAILELKNDNLTIINYGLNHTFINNIQIDDNVYVTINEGDYIYFGGMKTDELFDENAAYFIVRME